MENTDRKKRALITGITGQDGSYLAEFLLNKGYEVWGMLRRSSTEPLMRFQDLAFHREIKLVNANMRDQAALARVLEEVKPDEVYNLAAMSDVGISFVCPEETFEVDHIGVGKLFDEILHIVPQARVYQASSSEMYGSPPPPQNETPEFNPVSPYAEAKLKAHEKDENEE